MKGTDHFKNTIKAKLDEMAEEDPFFAEHLEKEGKSLDGCINYILHQVKKIGANGFADDEIFGMAAHYYEEDNIKDCNAIKCGVVVNHKPRLTDEEMEELKRQAREQVLAEERRRLTKKKEAPKPVAQPVEQEAKPQGQASLF